MQTVDDKKGKKLSQKEEASADKEGNHRDQTKKAAEEVDAAQMLLDEVHTIKTESVDEATLPRPTNDPELIKENGLAEMQAEPKDMLEKEMQSACSDLNCLAQERANSRTKVDAELEAKEEAAWQSGGGRAPLFGAAAISAAQEAEEAEQRGGPKTPVSRRMQLAQLVPYQQLLEGLDALERQVDADAPDCEVKVEVEAPKEPKPADCEEEQDQSKKLEQSTAQSMVCEPAPDVSLFEPSLEMLKAIAGRTCDGESAISQEVTPLIESSVIEICPAQASLLEQTAEAKLEAGTQPAHSRPLPASSALNKFRGMARGVQVCGPLF